MTRNTGSLCNYSYFSTSVGASSSLPWISPLQVPEMTYRKPEPSMETSDIPEKAQRKLKFLSHEYTINLIKLEKNPQRALEIFNRVTEQKGFNHNNATYAAMFHKLACSKKFQAVDALLTQMTYETCKFHEGIFVNLMKHFSKSLMHERVVDMFCMIQPVVREKPSLNALSTCLNLLVESGQIDLAKDLLLHSNAIRLRPNTCIFNILVKYHCKHNALVSALEVLKQMKSSKRSYPNSITYSTLMEGYCRNGKLEEAMDLFEEMVSKDQILPDPLTYNVLINGFCLAGKVDRALKILEFMKANGCNPNAFNYSTLMNGLCKEGKLKEAEAMLEEMKSSGIKPDAVVYTTLINSFCRDGRTNKALDLLKEMKDLRCRADTVTYNVLIGGMCRESRHEEALEMLQTMPYQGIHLNKGSYRIVLNSLSQIGDFDKASYLIELMLGRGFVPHYETSNELLGRFCENGMVDDAVNLLYGLLEMGFVPKDNVWTILVEVICRERKLLSTFKKLDELIASEMRQSDEI